MGEDGGNCLLKSRVEVIPNTSEMNNNIQSSDEVGTSTVKSTVQVMGKTQKDRSDGEISSSDEDNDSSHHNHKDRDHYSGKDSSHHNHKDRDHYSGKDNSSHHNHKDRDHYSGKDKYKRSRHSEDSGDDEYGNKRYRKNGSPERRRQPQSDERSNKTSTERRSHRYEGRNSDLGDNHRRYNEERKRSTQERSKGSTRLTENDYSSKKREKEHEMDKMPNNSSSLTNERKQIPESSSSSLSNQNQTTTSTEVKKKTTIGAYIPPSKLREMQAGITDKNSKEYQRMSWEALKKSINGLVNKVNTVNIEFIVMELLHENIVRGRGLVAQTIIRAQVASPTFTPVYASLVSIINTKFPKVGELMLRRLIIQFRKAYKRNDKRVCINSVKFIGHLINQQVAHELLALQILTLMLHNNHTGDSIEVAVSFLKEVGQKLLEVSPKGVNAVFERLRNILHDSQSDKRVQYMIEVLFHVRKDGFRDFQIIPEGLDNVEEDDQITHLLQLDDEGNEENILNVFKFDPEYVQNEEKYNQIKKNILGEESDNSSGDDDDGSDGDDDDDDDNDDDDDENCEEKNKETEIIDMTQTNLVALRRKLFLTIQSSLDFEECAHKMLKINLKEGQQHEFCLMVIEACAQDRSYQKFYGNLAHRFCLLRREFMEQYVIIFKEQYDNCHHLDTNKLRNTAKLFGHLLWSDGVPWSVLENIKLNEEETTASSRIFIKIIFQEVSEFLGIQKLLKRLKDPTIGEYLEGLFPRDNPVKTRFAVNFFTAIGLGILTDDLREHLRSLPKTSATAQKMAAAAGLESSSSSSSSSSESSDSSSSSSSDSSDSEGESKSKSRPHKRTKSSPKRTSKSKVSHRSK